MQIFNKVTGLHGLSVLAALTFFMGVPTAMAQEGARYKLETAADGYLKLDTFSGSMTYCSQQNSEFTCKVIEGTEAPDQDELRLLKDKVDALSKRLDALEQQNRTSKNSTLPTEEEFEQTMGMMERFMKRFMGIAKSFDDPETTPAQPAPDRT